MCLLDIHRVPKTKYTYLPQQWRCNCHLGQHRQSPRHQQQTRNPRQPRRQVPAAGPCYPRNRMQRRNQRLGTDTRKRNISENKDRLNVDVTRWPFTQNSFDTLSELTKTKNYIVRLLNESASNATLFERTAFLS